MTCNIIKKQVARIESRAADNNLKIDDILQEAGVHKSTFWRWKNGQAFPSLRTLDRIHVAINSLTE